MPSSTNAAIYSVVSTNSWLKKLLQEHADVGELAAVVAYHGSLRTDLRKALGGVEKALSVVREIVESLDDEIDRDIEKLEEMGIEDIIPEGAFRDSFRHSALVTLALKPLPSSSVDDPRLLLGRQLVRQLPPPPPPTLRSGKRSQLSSLLVSPGYIPLTFLGYLQRLLNVPLVDRKGKGRAAPAPRRMQASPSPAPEGGPSRKRSTRYVPKPLSVIHENEENTF
jgi:hypothetical protein